MKSFIFLSRGISVMGIEISGMVMLQISGKILEREYFVFCFISRISLMMNIWALDVGSWMLDVKDKIFFKLYFVLLPCRAPD